VGEVVPIELGIVSEVLLAANDFDFDTPGCHYRGRSTKLLFVLSKIVHFRLAKQERRGGVAIQYVVRIAKGMRDEWRSDST